MNAADILTFDPVTVRSDDGLAEIVDARTPHQWGPLATGNAKLVGIVTDGVLRKRRADSNHPRVAAVDLYQCPAAKLKLGRPLCAGTDMPPKIWTPEQWRERADQAIAIAEQVIDPAIKRVMYMMAERYHDLACEADSELARERKATGD